MSILKGKNVLITGATSGIGKAAAVKFAENNSNLILIGRRKDRLAELSDQLVSDYKIKVEFIQADVRDYKSLSRIIESQSELFKNTDILINNAGLARGFSHISGGDISD